VTLDGLAVEMDPREGLPVLPVELISRAVTSPARATAEFFAETEIDGALVGGASLKAAEFTQIVQAAR